MAITEVGTPQTTDAGFSSSRNAVNVPSGLANNDVLFAVLVTANAHTIGTVPSGWTQLGTTQDTTDASVSVIYRICDGTEGSTVDLGAIYGGAESGGTLTFAYRGLDTADLIEASDQSALTSTLTVASDSITPTENGCLILHIFGCDPDGPAITFDAETTPAATKEAETKTDTGDWSWVGVQSYIQSTAAAVSLTADITSGVSYPFGQFIVALNEASAAATPGLLGKTLERNGVAVAAGTASIAIWNGHSVDFDTNPVYKSASATLTSGAFADIDLSSTALSVSDNITVVVIPASGGPGIALETTVEEL